LGQPLLDKIITPSSCLPLLARVSIFTKTPIIERIYRILVSGPQSVLRRFLPTSFGNLPGSEYIKGETLYQQPSDKTVPASTNVTYSATNDNPGDGISGVGLTAGRGGAPSIYFPKVGSLYDYFLGNSGIYPNLQCTLRPYGSCRLPPTNIAVGPSGNCNPNAPAQDYAALGLCGPDAYANQASVFGPGSQAALCYNDVIQYALAANLDPAFVLTIWMNESGASNYSAFPNVWDFGMIFYPQNNFAEQISNFVTLPSKYLGPSMRCSYSSDLENFVAWFYPGTCDPNLPVCEKGNCLPAGDMIRTYIESLQGIYSQVTCPSTSTVNMFR
jgi:hypothetical protein